MSDLWAEVSVASARLGRFAGRIRHLHEVSSTSDVALALASNGSPEGTTIVADTQTAGRGRRGTRWISPAGAGLYFSTVLRPSVPPAQFAQLTLTAAIAVTEGLKRSTFLPIEIKWPNDLMVGGRKLGGLLAETAGAGLASGPVILGIGINITRHPYPPELSWRAVSLEEAAGHSFDRAALLIEILSALESRYSQFLASGFDGLRHLWCELSPSSVGRRVWWKKGAELVEGMTEGIDPDGALRLRVDTHLERVVGGEVTWLAGARWKEGAR